MRSSAPLAPARRPRPLSRPSTDARRGPSLSRPRHTTTRARAARASPRSLDQQRADAPTPPPTGDRERRYAVCAGCGGGGVRGGVVARARAARADSIRFRLRFDSLHAQVRRGRRHVRHDERPAELVAAGGVARGPLPQAPLGVQGGGDPREHEARDRGATPPVFPRSRGGAGGGERGGGRRRRGPRPRRLDAGSAPEAPARRGVGTEARATPEGWRGERASEDARRGTRRGVRAASLPPSCQSPTAPLRPPRRRRRPAPRRSRCG